MRRDPRRGSALLAVLWLAVALTGIAFALSRGVRTEFDRASLNVDGARAYYLARAGVEAAAYRMAASGRAASGNGFLPGQRYFVFQFPTGSVEVEVVGETGKLNVNTAPPEAIARVLGAMGADPNAAIGLAARIVEYRERSRERRAARDVAVSAPTNPSGVPTFSSSSASIEELEELLAVPGVTPDLLYGAWRTDAQGRLRRVGGLYANLTTEGAAGSVDVNYASPEMLLAGGLDPQRVAEIVARRRQGPIDRDSGLLPRGDGRGRDVALGLSGSSPAYTLIATATLGEGRARRSVAARVRAGVAGADQVRIVRWYDTTF